MKYQEQIIVFKKTTEESITLFIDFCANPMETIEQIDVLQKKHVFSYVSCSFFVSPLEGSGVPRALLSEECGTSWRYFHKWACRRRAEEGFMLTLQEEQIDTNTESQKCAKI